MPKDIDEMGDRDVLPDNVAAHGSIQWNAIVRMGAYGISVAINIMAVPFIIRGLGIEAYGVIGIINTFIAYMSIITISLTSTIGRNLTIAIEKKEFELASKEVSTAIYGLLAVICVLLVPLFILSYYIDDLIVMPSRLVNEARILFVLLVLAFVANSLAGVIGAGMFARNRLDLFSLAALSKTIVFVVCIVSWFSVLEPNITAYGGSILGSSIFLFIIHAVIYRKLLPGIEITRKNFDSGVLLGIFSLGVWMLVNQLGGLLFLQTDLIVANHILGSSATGKLAALLVIPLQLRVLAGLVSGLFAPAQVAMSVDTGSSSFGNYLLRSVRLTTLFMALLVGVFCGSASEILGVWLGEEYSELAPIAIVLTAYLVPTLGLLPCWNALLAVGKVKWPAVVTLTMGGGNVVLAVFLAEKMEMGLMGIALAGCIMLSLRNIIFTPWYVSRVCDIKFTGLIYELGVGVVFACVVCLTSSMIMTFFQPDTISMLIVSLVISGVCGGLILAPIVLRSIKGKEQRETI